MTVFAETEPDAFRVGPHLLAHLAASGDGGRDHTLPRADGFIRFRTGRAGPGITLTSSECRPRGNYRSRIDSALLLVATGPVWRHVSATAGAGAGCC